MAEEGLLGKSLGTIKKTLSTPFIEMSDYDQAAWLLDLAMRGKYVVAPEGDKTGLPKKPDAINVYSRYLFLTKYYHYAVYVSLALTVFETPLWCSGEGHLWVWVHSRTVCKIEGTKVLLSGVPLIPTGVGITIEILCFAVMLLKLWYEFQLEKFFADIGTCYRTPERRKEGVALVIIGLLDVIYFMLNLDSNFRLAPYVRFLLGATVPAIRRVLKSFISSAQAIVQVSFFLAGTIVLFAWVAALLFDDDMSVDRYGHALREPFQSFGYSLYSSFLAVTTTNLPDVMVSTISANRIYLLLWMPLLIFGAIIFMNVILAVVYNDYSDRMTTGQKTFYGANKKGLDATFDLIAENRISKTGETELAVGIEAFKSLLESLEKLHIKVETELVMFVFQGLDDDQSGYLNRSEFVDLCDVLQYKFELTSRDSPLQDIEFFRKMKPYVVNGKTAMEGENVIELGYSETFPGSPFDVIMNVVLTINVLFIMVESYYDLSNKEEPGYFQYLDFVFSFVYLIEVFVKLTVWSWSEYWSDGDNKFDFITSLLLAGAGILLLSGYAASLNLPQGEILMYLNILRLVRILKAFSNVPALRREFNTIIKMCQACSDVLLINFLVIYIWSAAGLQLFGGQLYVSNKQYSWVKERLDIDPKDMDYFDGNLQVLNFNDVPLGCVTLFFYALTGWVPEVSEAIINLAGEGAEANHFYQAAIYFYLLTFYVASPLIAFNVFTAFSIDVFTTITEALDKEEDMKEAGKAGEEGSIEANLDKIVCRLAYEQRKCLHIKASGAMEQSKVFRAMFAEEDDDKDGDDGDDGEDGGDDAAEKEVLLPGVHGDLDQE